MVKNLFLGLSTLLLINVMSSAQASTFRVEHHQGSGTTDILGEINIFDESSLSAADAYNYFPSMPRYNGIVSVQAGTNVFLSNTLNGLALFMVNQAFPSSIGRLSYQVTTEGSLLFRDDIMAVDNDPLITTPNTNGTTQFLSYEGFTEVNTDGLVLGLTDTDNDGRMVSWNYNLNYPLENIPRINFWSPDGENISIELYTAFNPVTDSIVLKEVDMNLEIPESSSNLALLGFSLATIAISWKNIRH